MLYRLCVGSVFGDNRIVTHSMRLLRVTRTAAVQWYTNNLACFIVCFRNTQSCAYVCMLSIVISDNADTGHVAVYCSLHDFHKKSSCIQ